MSKITLSSVLFKQIGGVNWQQRSDFVAIATGKRDRDVSPEPPPVLEFVEESIENLFEKQSKITVLKGHSIVVLGTGLDKIWQNDAQLAWQLWQNIMQAFDWDESQIVFFDTAHLVSEEMVCSTIEEVIELGVDWVLTMDETHELSEQLQEGVQVVSVPDMESMLFDPYAKQTFYHTVRPFHERMHG